MYGSVRGAARKGRPYRDPPWPQSSFPALHRQDWNRTNTGMNCWYVQAKFLSRRGLRQLACPTEADPFRESPAVTSTGSMRRDR